MLSMGSLMGQTQPVKNINEIENRPIKNFQTKLQREKKYL